jgi:hypothetical protein
MFEYKCPECDAVLRSANPAPPGKKVRCKKCQAVFVPRADTLALKDEPLPPKPAPAARHGHDDDDEDTGPMNYGVVRDEELEQQTEERKKATAGVISDKGKRSARGPAMALLVMPSNLLIFEGALTSLVGIIVVLVGIWPLVFTEVEPSEDEYREQAVYILFGVVLVVWGMLICLGASRMQNLESYTWALVGAVLGILPLLVGIFAVAMLRNPKVIAGFEEVEGAMSDDEEEDEDDEEDEE